MAKERVYKFKEGVPMEFKLPCVVRFYCCDCSLAHRIAFAIEENGKLGIAMEREQRESVNRRKTFKSEDKDLCLWPYRKCKAL